MRQRIQRMLTAAVGLLLLLSASGCGFSFSPTDLYSLPQLPEEYTELNSSLNSCWRAGRSTRPPSPAATSSPCSWRIWTETARRRRWPSSATPRMRSP